jgi:asparagine synthase (glutamine-hydrolysing)
MCGIVGAVGLPGDVDTESIAAAVRTLRHRGPDRESVWASGDRRIGLAHSRLSIIDLEHGDQPITNEDGTVRIVVNGEFYDFERIRAELQAKGHVFRTHSDSEILVHLYEEYGVHCLEHLRGEFAFLLWDEPHRRLFAARDRFGIKPLYWAVRDGVTVFASEVKALFAAGIPAAWDRDALLAGILAPPNDTLFKGVRQIPPAHYMLVTSGQPDVQPYWDVDFPIEGQERWAEAAEHIEELRATLHQAVKLRLRADVPVACYLSGGLDSCAVLGIASAYSPKPLRAYTLSFDHADYDERKIAEAQAILSGAEFVPIDITSETMADHFGEAIYHAERPFINAHCVAKFLLSLAVHDDSTRVVLTGEGSDEVFAGYAPFRKDLVGHLAKTRGTESALGALAELEATNKVSQGVLLAESGDPNMERVTRRLGYSPGFMEPWAQGRTANLNLLSEECRRLVEHQDPFSRFLDYIDVPRRLAGRHPVNQSLYLWGKSLLPNYIVSNLGDRMEMAHSVEGRVPFLDHKVVECAAKMPVEMKINGMTEKYVLREAARPVLTDEVYRRQKHPFLSPPSTIQVDGRLYAMVQDTLRGASLAAIGIYDQKKVVALLDSLATMDPTIRARLDPILMSMLSHCLLQQRFSL